MLPTALNGAMFDDAISLTPYLSHLPMSVAPLLMSLLTDATDLAIERNLKTISARAAGRPQRRQSAPHLCPPAPGTLYPPAAAGWPRVGSGRSALD
jgi:hypothetical protein